MTHRDAHRIARVAAAGLAPLLAVAQALAGLPEAAGAFRAGDCPFPVPAQVAVVCGSIAAPENPDLPQGRRIDLNVVWIRAAEPLQPRRALFEFEGGPGFGVTDRAPEYLGALAPLRRHHDIVLFDMRGTGRSNPLVCRALTELRATDRNAPLFPPPLVEQCRSELAQHADLRHYTTANAARDIEIVRHALNYEQIDLYANSYGSTLALAYLATHPERVRSALLAGVAPAELQPPRLHAPAAQRALLLHFEECAAAAACDAVFPALPAALERLRQRFEQQPMAPFSFEIFMEKIRERLYRRATALGIPDVIYRAAEGDFGGFMAPPLGGPGRLLADGLYLSITCAESFPFFDYEEASAQSRATWFGDYRLRRQRVACQAWNVPPSAPPSLSVPLDTPVLLISGRLDPVTPREWAESVQRALPRSRHLVLAREAHGVWGFEDATCLVELHARFLADPHNVDEFLQCRDPAASAGCCARTTADVLEVLNGALK